MEGVNIIRISLLPAPPLASAKPGISDQNDTNTARQPLASKSKTTRTEPSGGEPSGGKNLPRSSSQRPGPRLPARPRTAPTAGAASHRVVSPPAQHVSPRKHPARFSFHSLSIPHARKGGHERNEWQKAAFQPLPSVSAVKFLDFGGRSTPSQEKRGCARRQRLRSLPSPRWLQPARLAPARGPRTW
jgi:hypothetical protein